MFFNRPQNVNVVLLSSLLIVCGLVSGPAWAVTPIAVGAIPVSSSVATITPATSFAQAAVLSFREWRQDKSAQVKSRYTQLETEYLAKKTENPQDKKLKSLYNDLKNTKSHLDEIEELTVSDYFVGYLSRFKDQKSAFHAAASKLDSSEVAELMRAYADSLLKTSGEGISTARPGPTTEASK